MRYGKAPLNIPTVFSPSLERSKDGWAVVPRDGATFTWTASEDATYDISLLRVDEGVIGTPVMEETGVSKNRYTIPSELLTPGNSRYYFFITAISAATGEKVGYGSDPFRVYGPAAIAGEARITAPLWGSLLHTDRYAPVIPYTGDLEVSWEPGENAVKYGFMFYGNGTGSVYFPILMSETTQTHYTVPRKTIDRWRDNGNTQGFYIVVAPEDAYGNVLGDHTWHLFHFGPGAMGVAADGTALSADPAKWTPVGPGAHTLTWKAVDGATGYELNLFRVDDEDSYERVGGSYGAGTTRAEVTLEGGHPYLVILHAKDGDRVLDGGWYYVGANASFHNALRLLKPTADLVPRQKLNVAWADAGAASYSVGLYRMAPGDEAEKLNDLGGANPYYSTLVVEEKGLTGTSWTVPAASLEYAGMYRVVVTARYSDGGLETADALIKVCGDPALAPKVTGVAWGDSPSAPGANAVGASVGVQWSEAAERYEAALYTLDGAGKRNGLLAVVRGGESEAAFPASLLKAGKRYELALRAYDADGFSSEYRRYFRVD